MDDNSSQAERIYSIGELAEQAGISRRTVRYYVQRGLIDPPQGQGRASHYTQHHAEQIQRVLTLQRGGLRLEDITALSEDSREEAIAAAPQSNLVLRVLLAPGISLELNAGSKPPTNEQLQELAKAAQRILRPQEVEEP